MNEVLKQVMAQYNAPQLLTQREQVSRKIKAMLVERARDFNIILEDVSIVDLQFGKEFTAAVEAKQVGKLRPWPWCALTTLTFVAQLDAVVVYYARSPTRSRARSFHR